LLLLKVLWVDGTISWVDESINPAVERIQTGKASYLLSHRIQFLVIYLPVCQPSDFAPTPQEVTQLQQHHKANKARKNRAEGRHGGMGADEGQSKRKRGPEDATRSRTRGGRLEGVDRCVDVDQSDGEGVDQCVDVDQSEGEGVDQVEGEACTRVGMRKSTTNI
jgi:hypothetical protein